MIICHCKKVTDKDICCLLEKGCEFKEICEKTGACSGCGCCEPAVAEMIVSGKILIKSLTYENAD